MANPNNSYLDPDNHLCGFTGPDMDELLDTCAGYSTRRWDWEPLHLCITGKDADLEPCGQQGAEVREVTDTHIHCIAHIGKTVAGEEAYLEVAQDIVCCAGLSGDWTGDDWYLYERIPFTVEVVYDDENDGWDYDAMADAIQTECARVLKDTQDALVAMDKQIHIAAGYEEVAQ